jgi:hypothetical protein
VWHNPDDQLLKKQNKIEQKKNNVSLELGEGKIKKDRIRLETEKEVYII